MNSPTVVVLDGNSKLNLLPIIYIIYILYREAMERLEGEPSGVIDI